MYYTFFRTAGEANISRVVMERSRGLGKRLEKQDEKRLVTAVERWSA